MAMSKEQVVNGLSIGTLATLVALGASLLLGARSRGRDDGKIEATLQQKLDQADYQRDQTALAERLGTMAGDIRVIRAAICGKAPGACQ